MEIRSPKGQIIKPSKWRKNKNGREPYQGTFYPANPQKYTGDVNGIVFRSGMELRMMKYLDERKNVLAWSSEETVVPYVSPIDNRLHRYFVDFQAVIQGPKGNRTILFEVKESTATRPPKAPKTGKKTARFVRETMTYAVNMTKWETARKVCEQKGWEFIILTDKDLRF